jgi:hypothetical protein
MSTVAEIERAIGELPPEQWNEIRRWMESHPQKPGKRVAARRVDWSKSAAVTRPRASETRLDASVVTEALAAVRE